MDKHTLPPFDDTTPATLRSADASGGLPMPRTTLESLHTEPWQTGQRHWRGWPLVGVGVAALALMGGMGYYVHQSSPTTSADVVAAAPQAQPAPAPAPAPQDGGSEAPAIGRMPPPLEKPMARPAEIVPAAKPVPTTTPSKTPTPSQVPKAKPVDAPLPKPVPRDETPREPELPQPTSALKPPTIQPDPPQVVPQPPVAPQPLPHPPTAPGTSGE